MRRISDTAIVLPAYDSAPSNAHGARYQASRKHQCEYDRL